MEDEDCAERQKSPFAAADMVECSPELVAPKGHSTPLTSADLVRSWVAVVPLFPGGFSWQRDSHSAGGMAGGLFGVPHFVAFFVSAKAAQNFLDLDGATGG